MSQTPPGEKLFFRAAQPERDASFFSLLEWQPRLLVALISLPVYILICAFGLDIGFEYFKAYHGYYSLSRDILFSPEHSLWSPYQMSGHPALFMPTVCYLYPPQWIYAILPDRCGMPAMLLLHIFLAGQFMYLFARQIGLLPVTSVFAAVLLCLGGYFPHVIYEGQIYGLYSFVWFPLCLMLLDRAMLHRRKIDLVFSGAALGMIHLSGMYQYYLLFLYAVIFYALFVGYQKENRAIGVLRSLSYGGGVAFLSLVIGAVCIIPLITSLNIYDVYGGMSFKLAQGGMLSIPALAQLFFPLPFGDNYRYSVLLYGGALALPLILAAINFLWKDRRLAALFLLGLISFLIASSTSVYWMFYVAAPGFNMFYSPIRYTLVFVIILPLMMAAALEKILTNSPASFGVKWRKIVFAGAYSGVAFYTLMAFLFKIAPGFIKTLMAWSVQALKGKNWTSDVLDNAFGEWRVFFDISDPVKFLPLLSVVVFLGVYYYYRANRLSLKWLAALVAVAVCVECGYFDWRMAQYNYSYKERADALFQKDEMVELLRNDPEPGRVFKYQIPSTYTEAMFQKTYHLDGDGLWSRRYAAYCRRFGRVDETLKIKNPGDPLLGLLNAKYMISNPGLVLSGWEHVKTIGDRALYRRQSVVPYAFLAFKYLVMPPDFGVVKSKQELANAEQNYYNAQLDKFKNGKINPAEVVTLEKEPELGIGAFDPHARVTQKHRSPDRLELEVESAQNALLVVSESYFPGWKVTIDDKPAEILPANVALRAVAVPAQKHIVKFFYQPWEQYIGAGITIGWLLFVALLLTLDLVGARRKRRAHVA